MDNIFLDIAPNCLITRLAFFSEWLSGHWTLGFCLLGLSDFVKVVKLGLQHFSAT